MRFSMFAGAAVIPTLSRLVLCAAFLAAGWNKCFTFFDVSAEQATSLRALGVSVVERQVARTVSLVQDEEEPPPAVEPEPPAVIPPDVASPEVTLPTTAYQVRGVHRVTLLLQSCQWPRPALMAWAAALTELFGGGLLLLGLFSRIWGLGLAIAMGVAFYLTSLPGVLSMEVFNLNASTVPFNMMFCQLGLLVLALGVMLTGPGPLSLDHRIFRRSRGGMSGLDDDLGSDLSTRPI